MNIGISTACFYPYINTEDTIDIIKELGFDICEVFVEASLETEEEFCFKLRDKADKLGVSVHSIHAFNANFEPFLFDRYERRRNEMENKFRAVCNAGSIIGAKYYTFHGMTKQMPINDIDFIADGMRKLCTIAKEYNIGISWENVSWGITNDPEFIKKIYGRIEENLFYTLDIKQAIRSNHSPDEYIDIYGNKISTVHINDASPVSTCLLPGEGNINLKDIVKRVRNIDKLIPFIIEVYSNNYSKYDQLIAAKNYLQSLVNNL